MASIERRMRVGKVRWYARYRDPSGEQRVKVFDRKVDAERFVTGVESAKLAGSYIDPALARVTVGEWANRWLAGLGHLKPSTADRYAGIVRKYIAPRWGSTRLADVSHADVQGWIRQLGHDASPATVRKIHRVLSLILSLAVDDGRLVRNPAARIKLPRGKSQERQFLTHDQVHLLADACASPPPDASKHGPIPEAWNKSYRLIVLFLAYTGLRWGEMAALRVKRIDLERRRVEVIESVTVVRGVLTWGTTKGHSHRDVPLPRFLAAELGEFIKGKEPDDLVFPGSRGGPLRSKVFQEAVLTAAAKRSGLAGFTPHSFRHTAASLAIASGADVKVVQQMLGHKSATMTLDLYGHLFGDRLDDIADRLDSASRSAREKRGSRKEAKSPPEA